MPAKKLIISGNPMEIDWPRDEYQMTHKLRIEAKRAAARVAGDEKKLQVLKETMLVAIAHAEARFKK